MTGDARPFLVALSVPQRSVTDLLHDPEAVRRLDAADLAFVVFGYGKFDPQPTDHAPVFDPSTVVSFLARNLVGTGLLQAYAPHRDHPYNIARRVASADQITHGRGGIVIGFADHTVGDPNRDGAAWDLGRSVGLDPATVAEATEVLTKLWQSWPVDAIIADRASKRYVDTSVIRALDHDARYRVDGALTTPSSEQGLPVIAARVENAAELQALGGRTDLLIDASRHGDLEIAAVDTQARRLRQVRFDGDATALAAAVDQARSAGADGVLVIAAEHVDLDALLSGIDAAGLRSEHQRTALLRQALGLADRDDLLADARPAFAAAE